MAQDTTKVPAEVAERISAGENPVRVWREYRKVTHEQIMERTGLKMDDLQKIEAGQTRGYMAAVREIAGILDVPPERLDPGLAT